MRPIIYILWLSCLAGCVTAPDVQMLPEAVSISEIEKHGEIRTEAVQWWLVLDDDLLHQLITQGLAGSPSSHIALARLAQAEADLKIAQADRWPDLVGLGRRDARNFSGREPDTRADLGALGLSWDAGLWGKRRLEIEFAQQFRQQRWFEHQTARLVLSASIAETYFQIVELRNQGALLAAQTQVSRDLERLIDARFRLGQAPANEIYQQREQTTALQQLALVNNTLAELLENTLDVLLGEIPDQIARVGLVDLPPAPNAVIGGTVDDLVRNRADIRAGFARLQQAASRAGIRFAERLPSLQVSVSFNSLTQKAFSSEWLGHGLDLSAPLFTGGRLKGLENRALQALEEERQQYLQLWLAALEEVRSLRWQYEQQEMIIATVASRRGYAQQALKASRDRYIRGDQNYLDVLTALRGLQEADRSLLSERSQLVTLWIRATQAVGQPMCHETSSNLSNKMVNDTTTCQEHWSL
ncbi:MAG: TolC family protein [Pseudomonadota bacterium]